MLERIHKCLFLFLDFYFNFSYTFRSMYLKTRKKRKENLDLLERRIEAVVTSIFYCASPCEFDPYSCHDIFLHTIQIVVYIISKSHIYALIYYNHFNLFLHIK